MIDKKQLACDLLELKYLDSRGYDVDDLLNVYDEIYPRNWGGYKNYDSKIQMLVEAIDKNIKIDETDKYKEHIKGKKI